MGRSGHSCTHRQPRIMARYRSNVFSEGLGRQKGLFRARYSRNVFPNTVFHCFSPLKTYIRSLCCQQHAVRACISATYCHEGALLPSRPPLGIHDNRFLPLFNAQPSHAGHSGGGARRVVNGRILGNVATPHLNTADFRLSANRLSTPGTPRWASSTRASCGACR